MIDYPSSTNLISSNLVYLPTFLYFGAFFIELLIFGTIRFQTTSTLLGVDSGTTFFHIAVSKFDISEFML